MRGGAGTSAPCLLGRDLFGGAHAGLEKGPAHAGSGGGPPPAAALVGHKSLSRLRLAPLPSEAARLPSLVVPRRGGAAEDVGAWAAECAAGGHPTPTPQGSSAAHAWRPGELTSAAIQAPAVADSASRSHTRQRFNFAEKDAAPSRHKSWAAPRVPAKESAAADSSPLPCTPTACDQGRHDAQHEARALSPQGQGTTPLVRRDHRRHKTWAAPRPAGGAPEGPGPPAEAPAADLPSPAGGAGSEASAVGHASVRSLRQKTREARLTFAAEEVCGSPLLTVATTTPKSLATASLCGDTTPGSTRFSDRASDAGPPRVMVNGMGWTRGEKLGAGSYGCVHKAMDKEAGLIFAVKSALFEEGNEDDRRFRARLEDELNICRELRHPHIISYLGHHYHEGTLHIYLEYAAGGAMATILKEFGALERPQLRKATRGLVDGLNYLHTRTPPVVHRDIKGANILIDLNFCVKLADFGCSKRDAITKSFSTIGSLPWMAPEVIQQKDGHGRKADIWSVGCTCIEMASAQKPWGNDILSNWGFALNHIAFSNETPPIPEAVTGSCRDLIRSCLRRLPDERPWAEELLGHHFLRTARCQSRHSSSHSGVRALRRPSSQRMLGAPGDDEQP